MENFILFKGLALGFVLAMPIGPMAILCISRTIEKGPRLGLAIALGIATADGFYGTVAGIGITLLITFIGEYSLLLKLIGGIFLIYLGVKIIKDTTAKKSDIKIDAITLIKTYFTIVALTIINPMTIATYVGAFAGMGISKGSGNLILGLELGFGTFLGSILWHLVIVTSSTLLKNRTQESHLKMLNKCSGLILCGFGIIALMSFL